MQLSPNFSLAELTKSQAASRHGISNQPSTTQIQNLKNLCAKILQPVRDHYKKPVVVSSGYRSTTVNGLIGGAHTSQHCLGQAADFEIPGLPNKEVAQWIKDNLDYDQLILEFYDAKDPRSGWIHCSYVSSHLLNRNRKQALVFAGKEYKSWA